VRTSLNDSGLNDSGLNDSGLNDSGLNDSGHGVARSSDDGCLARWHGVRAVHVEEDLGVVDGCSHRGRSERGRQGVVGLEPELADAVGRVGVVGGGDVVVDVALESGDPLDDRDVTAPRPLGGEPV